MDEILWIFALLFLPSIVINIISGIYISRHVERKVNKLRQDVVNIVKELRKI
jgi:hypothetical protein